MPETDEEYIEKHLKVVLLGEPSTGKTAFVNRYCYNDFTRQYVPTSGVDFISKRVNVQNDKYVRLIIWDVSGHALQSSMLNKYVFNANVILLFFDITNTSSFMRISEWIGALNKIRIPSSTTVSLVANKCDMEHQRSVTTEKQVKLANDNGFTLHSISARTGENVMSSLQRISAEFLGLKLSRAEQEAQNKVIKAEIFSPPGLNYRSTSHQTSPSTVCCVQ